MAELRFLEQIPKELIVDVVVILDFGRLHESSQQARTAVRRGLLQICIAALHFFAEKLGGPICFAEVRQRVVDVIRQVTLGLAQILDLCGFAIDARLEDRRASPGKDSASGETERTSTRMLFSLPIGIRIIDPRSTGDALS